jgi:hypothetical protein
MIAGARLYAYGRRHRLVFGTKSNGLDDNTIADLEWKLGYLIGHFGRM